MADSPYAGLRSMALGTTAEALKLDGVGPGECYGVVMDTGYERAVVTLACFLTGDASLYFSNGGGIIGSGQHASVAAAAKQFIQMAAKFVPQMQVTAESPTPAVGMTFFYALTPRARYSFGAPEIDFGNKRSILFPLFYAGQDVVTAIRLVQK